MADDFKVPNLKWPKGTRWATLPNGWRLAIVQVSPELASSMLELNAENQRSKKPAAIRRYATDMSSGDWKLTHQGIAFNASGRLHDGQNRLSAVVESGTTIEMLVFVGAGKDKEMTLIDTNSPRSVRDAANVVRMQLDRTSVSTMLASIRHGVVNGTSIINQMTHSSKLALLNRYSETLAHVAGWFGGSKLATKLGTAPVRGAIFCAACKVSNDALARFVRVFTEQEDGRTGEGAAKRFRAYLVSDGMAPDREIFLKTCRAIQHFVNREEPLKLTACSDNPFPFDAE